MKTLDASIRRHWNLMHMWRRFRAAAWAGDDVTRYTKYAADEARLLHGLLGCRKRARKAVR